MAPSGKSANRSQPMLMTLGIYLMSLATVGAGVLDLIWHDFDPGHQPFGGLGYYMPDRTIFACIAGVWLMLAGSVTLWRGAERLGLFAIAAIYFIFGLLSVPHFYTMLHKYGFHMTLIIGIIGQVFLQLMVVAGCLAADSANEGLAHPWSTARRAIAAWMLGLGGILTGIGHLLNTKGLVHMVPNWMPFGASMWIVISGVAFILAGVAILTGIVTLLATRLLALMLFIFQIILTPILFVYPHVHQAWGATAFNLAVAGSVCIFAASTASCKTGAHATVPGQVADVW